MAADTAPLPAEAAVLSGVAPYLMLADAAGAADLYARAFGAKEVNRYGEPGRIMHLHMHLNGASLMLMDPMPEHGHPLQPPQGYTLHLQVDDVRAWWDRALAAGMEIIMPLDVQFWGDRYGAVRDRYGVQWSMGGKP